MRDPNSEDVRLLLLLLVRCFLAAGEFGQGVGGSGVLGRPPPTVRGRPVALRHRRLTRTGRLGWAPGRWQIAWAGRWVLAPGAAALGDTVDMSSSGPRRSTRRRRCGNHRIGPQPRPHPTRVPRKAAPPSQAHPLRCAFYRALRAGGGPAWACSLGRWKSAARRGLDEG